MKNAEYRAFVFAHIALFIVYVWFGSLKLFGFSPANPLVDALLRETLPFVTFHTFNLILGAYEVLVGLLFIIPRKEKYAFILLVPHIIVTILPLFLLKAMTWQSALVPTIEGQYIIKNVLIIAVAAMVFADMKKKRQFD
ncbi:MAG TPA: hypothetical protein VHD69_02110 [Candidatus Paceibacterota bacterium]|jgi:uncharacterized membrane protein YkgB|nr:hypothetical protein [Candidatus Paceibacterota bacterium]